MSSIGETGGLVGLSFLLVLPVLLCMAETIHWMLLLDVCIRYYLAKAVSGFGQLFPTSTTGDAPTDDSPYQRLCSALQLIIIALIWLRVCDDGRPLPMTWSLNIGLPGHTVRPAQTTQPIFDQRSALLPLTFSRRNRRVSLRSSKSSLNS